MLVVSNRISSADELDDLVFGAARTRHTDLPTTGGAGRRFGPGTASASLGCRRQVRVAEWQTR